MNALYNSSSGDLITPTTRGRGIKKMIGKNKTRSRPVETNQSKLRSYSEQDAGIEGYDFSMDKRHSGIDYENLVEDLVEGEEGRTIRSLTKSKIEESLDLVLGPDVNNKIQELKTNQNDGKRFKNVNNQRRRSRSQDSFFFQNIAHQFMGPIDEIPSGNTGGNPNLDLDAFETSSSSSEESDDEVEEETPKPLNRLANQGLRRDSVEPLVDLDFTTTSEIRRMSSTFENLRLDQLDFERFGQIENSLNTDFAPEQMITSGRGGYGDPLNMDYRY